MYLHNILYYTINKHNVLSLKYQIEGVIKHHKKIVYLTDMLKRYPHYLNPNSVVVVSTIIN